MRRLLLAIVPILLTPSVLLFGEPSSPRWHFITNEHLRVGVDLNAGACIGWISTTAEPDKNLLNTYDRGRYLQQSYYGDPDGSDWNGKPWRYNPVQGGDWRNQPSEILKFEPLSPNSLQVKTQPRHWATGKKLEDVVLSQTVTLKDDLLHVQFEIDTTSAITHKPYHQELPALFVQPEYDTLLHAEKTDAPLTRTQPGQANTYIALPERWVAWTNPHGHAIAILSPKSDQATCYRAPIVPGTQAGCSYVAPIATLPITPNFTFQYEIWLGVGKVDSLRAKFRLLMQKTPAQR
ncbi:hypothetical protein FEM03_20260 [Phragmitibacter flavus]|uniref:DUF4380 domain-containing protein n=1 Tax=Phragmitibacter flavus TaxID=2576071 RepID=A0A5R8K9J9_9BACT|nr:hypothetical protein [Phragmitibacter flavus]TLD68996.1 hypothetical protein FEM03_20260 [Phragmitibacter flavus]